MSGIKRLITRLIAVVAVAAVALALLPSPAAADHGDHHVLNGICGYTQDLYLTDENGHLVYERDADNNVILDANDKPIPIPSDQKYLMRYIDKDPGEGERLVCSDNNGAWPLGGSTTSALSIADIFRNRPSTNRKNWCISTMFQNAARVPNTDTTADGDSGNTISIRTGTQQVMGQTVDVYTTWKSDYKVRDFDDLVAGAVFCRTGTF